NLISDIKQRRLWKASSLSPPRASELDSSRMEEEEEIISSVAGMQGGRWLKTSMQNSLSSLRATLVRLRPRGGSMAS
ncbi:hypothetical protein KUCAC02_018521, partial [Chaenocephalus aceratus]